MNVDLNISPILAGTFTFLKTVIWSCLSQQCTQRSDEAIERELRCAIQRRRETGWRACVWESVCVCVCERERERQRERERAGLVKVFESNHLFWLFLEDKKEQKLNKKSFQSSLLTIDDCKSAVMCTQESSVTYYCAWVGINPFVTQLFGRLVLTRKEETRMYEGHIENRRSQILSPNLRGSVHTYKSQGEGESEFVWDLTWVYLCVCVCVTERERERERESLDTPFSWVNFPWQEVSTRTLV